LKREVADLLPWTGGSRGGFYRCYLEEDKSLKKIFYRHAKSSRSGGRNRGQGGREECLSRLYTFSSRRETEEKGGGRAFSFPREKRTRWGKGKGGTLCLGDRVKGGKNGRRPPDYSLLPSSMEGEGTQILLGKKKRRRRFGEGGEIAESHPRLLTLDLLRRGGREGESRGKKKKKKKRIESSAIPSTLSSAGKAREKKEGGCTTTPSTTLS